jgi:outer membrane protein assembly factor BamB
LIFLWDKKDAVNVVHYDGWRFDCVLEARGKADHDAEGRMVFSGGAFVAPEAEKRLLEACRLSDELGVEAVVRPASLSVTGPARIISFSSNASSRNFTLGQAEDKLVLRLRTSQSDENGTNPEITLGPLKEGVDHHVIVSYQPGRLRYYLNGKLERDFEDLKGDLQNWSEHTLIFGDEADGERLWSGALDGVAIFNRAIDEKEAAQRYELSKNRRASESAGEKRMAEAKKGESNPTSETAKSLTDLVARSSSAKPQESEASDWPQWRGPNRNGLSPESFNWPQGWPPRQLWSYEAGEGSSSPIMVEGLVYLTGWKAGTKPGFGEDVLHCLEAETGKVVWTREYPGRWQGRLRVGDEDAYGGPISTPTHDPADKAIYLMGVDGDLRRVDPSRQGEVVWHVNLHERFKISQRPSFGRAPNLRDFGQTCSPLIVGDWVIVEANAAEGMVMALDKATGKTRWNSEWKGPAGHSGGPVTLEVEEIPCLVSLGLDHAVVMRLDAGNEGKTVATIPWRADFGCNIPTPAVLGNRIIISSGQNVRKTSLFEISLNGAKQIWESRSAAVVSSPLISGDSVYIIENKMFCLDLNTGKSLWAGGRFVDGSCVADPAGRVLVWGAGNLALLDAQAGEYAPLFEQGKLSRTECYPGVAFSRGLIVCKDRAGRSYCFSVRNP